MYEFDYTQRFIRDVKRLKRKHVDMGRLDDVLAALEHYDIRILASQYRDHKLQGRLSQYRELHIEGDWLLVYRLDAKRNTIRLVRTGTHEDILP